MSLNLFLLVDQLVIMIHPVLTHPMNTVVTHLEPDSLEAAEVVDAAAIVAEEVVEAVVVVIVGVEAAAVAVDAEGDTVVETKAVMEGMAATEE